MSTLIEEVPVETKRTIPYVDLPLQHKAIRKEILEAVETVLDHGHFILGPQVALFEEDFKRIIPSSEVVGLNSGTDALILALKALGIGPGDEVITAPNSFVASTSCICLVGATPVFVDVDHSYNIDPGKIEAAITPRTKAILPVHLTGRPADMDPIMKLAKKYNLFVIEDCAQAILAKYKDKFVGMIGDIGCFSLHPLKTLNACGDGGVLITSHKEVAEKVRIYRNLGLRTREDCIEWCSNSRLDAFQAAIVSVKLKYIAKWTEQRRVFANLYRSLLCDIQDLIVPQDYEYSVYHTFVILANRRNELQKYLADEGIGTAIHYPIPIHLQTVGKKLGTFSFPIAEAQANRILSLPIHQDLTLEEIHYVASAIRKFYSL